MSVVGFVCRAGRAKMIIAILLTGCELQHDCRSSIEIVPGSHHLEGPIHSYAAEQAHAAYGGQDAVDYNKLLISGRFADAIAQPEHTQSPARVNMKRGDIWLMDHRIFHRGTPVDVAAPGRPELMYCFRASLCPTTA